MESPRKGDGVSRHPFLLPFFGDKNAKNLRIMSKFMNLCHEFLNLRIYIFLK